MNNDKTITYMHNHALFFCDCGKDVLAANWWGLYKGKCSKCGLSWELKKRFAVLLTNPSGVTALKKEKPNFETAFGGMF